ncbi:PAS domain S-box protein [Desulfosporosinus sp. Sb-LF]|uniref:PAS domain S-box protein n=1 Tax=Desulfosporosinus sp. Sb-LF TaxID=2560027 RepID=UPI00107FB0BE|nr:PAS domain S-box protein [Desulfosporosinus sp. Sb-LF]TGE34593.1 PAS domain S-box protein [Desulfosporosinus sp. Sb-LF]
MYYNFVISGIMVLFLCGVAILLDLLLKRKYSDYLLGVMFGLITIFVMGSRMGMRSSSLDFRHITMTMAGFIGGPVTALIAAIISALYRYFSGGSGLIGSITIIIVFGCFGTVLGKNLRSKQNGKKLIFWFLVGIVMSIMLLLIIGFFSPWTKHAQAILRIVWGPYLIITPLATTIIFNFYYWVYGCVSKASILNAIINSSPINIMIFDAQGSIMISKNIKTELKAYPFIENLFPSLYTDKTWPNTTEPQHREINTEDGKHFVTDLSSFKMPCGENAFVAIINDVTDRKSEQEKLRAANEKFYKAFQLGPHMMAIIRKSDYRYVDVNRRFLEARDFQYEDVIGKTPIEIGVPQSEFSGVFEAIQEQGSVKNVESTIVSKYGSRGTAILSAETIQIDDQECILFAYNDVTEMKRMQTERLEQLTKNLELEADLAKSNQFIADIINNMPDGFYALDNQWRFTFVNKKVEELFLKTQEELIGEVLWVVDPQARGTILELNFSKARTDFLPITFEYLSSLHIDSWHQITAYPSEVGMSVYYRDVTEEKLASEKLIKSQEEKVSILESMTDCFYAMDRDLQFTYINHAAEIAFGKSRGQLLGKKMTEVFKANDTALYYYHEVINEKRSVTFEIISEALGGKWLEISVYHTKTGVTCYFRDITSRKTAEETLRQSEEKFSKAFHGGPIMMLMATIEEGQFIDVNEALCSSTGYTREEIIGHTSKELNFFVEADKRQKLKKMLVEQSKTENEEFDFRTKSGEIRYGLSWSQLFYLDGNPCHITGLIDVTEQKRIQKEMAKLDRLNLIGQLAAGIAHEIRNPMTTVRGYLQLIGAKPDYSALKDTFALMISELDRANFIITEFLSLAQTKPTELKSQNLNDIINHLYPLLEADTFTQNKQLYFIPGKIPNLDLNRNEIFQMILNLTRNGLEAMEQGGSLTIKSYVEDSKVVLSIADEGCGIPQENLNKLGIPFFTTKDTGTGLGIATCYRISESHCAKINIDSSPSGTTISILFPIPDEKPEIVCSPD